MSKKELEKEALRKIAEAKKLDSERAHIEADAALCDLLIELGYGNVVMAWSDVDRLYS